MTLEPLLNAPLAVQLHVATVLPAAVIGAFLLVWRGKGTPLHRLFGKIWFTLMIATAVTTFFIHELNVLWGFSPIHLLSVTTIAGCIYAYRTARQGNIRAHRIAVQQVYIGGIVIAGGFTLLPHRIMHLVIFGPDVSFGQILMVVIPLTLFAVMVLYRARLPAASH